MISVFITRWEKNTEVGELIRLESVKPGPDFQKNLRQSYDNLTTILTLYR